MKFLFASDSFKGSLSSQKTAELLAKAAREIFPDCQCDSIVVADGGEGTTAAVLAATNGKKLPVQVHGPLWEDITSNYGMLDENRAVMEMAAASGLPLVPEEKRDPRYTTSYGTGEMIADALRRGFRDISIAIGGSATNDGGIGCIRALGGKFLDENNQELKGCGEDLMKIRKIDLSGLNPLIKECKFTVMCDVTNPLCGKDGATYTFGRQKGATPEIQNDLEAGMCNYRDIIKEQFDLDMDNIPGSGAAGGLGTALMVFLNGTLKSGIETVLDLVDFDEHLKDVDIVVTGEGRLDGQTVMGKAPIGVAKIAKQFDKPVLAFSGCVTKDATACNREGIDAFFPVLRNVVSLEDAMNPANARQNMADTAEQVFRTIRTFSSL